MTAKIKVIDGNRCWQGCGTTEILVYCCWKGRLTQPLWKIAWQFLIKAHIHLLIQLYDPPTPLRGVHPREM